MQNNGKQSRPDQAYGQQANRPARNSHTASKHISAPRISSRATPSNLGSSRRKTGTATHTEGRISTSSLFRTITSTTA